MTSHKETIIFDFDGTVGDTMPFIFTVANELAQQNGFDTVTHEQFDELRDMSPFDIISKLHIPIWKIPFILHHGRQLLKKYMREVPYVEGMRDALYALKAQQYTLGMLTSNSQENIDIFLKRNKLDVFDFVNTERNIFGKQFSLRNIINAHKLVKDNTLYIGDEVRDIEACQTLGLDIVSVTWGFNSKKVLKKYNPTYLIDKPAQLVELLKRS